MAPVVPWFQQPLLLAFLALIVSFAALVWILGAFRTEKEEAKAGIALLCAMRWNEFSRLITEMLKDRGMAAKTIERPPGQDGFDLLFTRGTSQYLVACKNAANQVITKQTVAHLYNLTHFQEADGAIIASCAPIEAEALKLAKDRRIEVIATEDLWAHVKPWVAHDQRVDAEAFATKTKQKRLILSALIAALIAIIVFSVASLFKPEPLPPALIENAAEVPMVTPANNKISSSNTAIAMPDAALTDDQLEARRASALLETRGLTRLKSAAWSTKSTLQVITHDPIDGVELESLVNDICRSLLQFEELRFTRLQVEIPTGNDANPLQVRWRQCR